MKLGYLSLTEFCPNRCLACPCESSRRSNAQELDVERIFEDIRRAEAEGGFDRLILSGGEPTCHSRFIAVMEVLGKRSFPVSLTTTSERFAEPTFLRDVLSVFPASRLSVTTALHSFDPVVHDAMTRTAGSFRRWLGGLLALEAAGVSTTLKHLLSRPTIEDLSLFIDEYYRRFAPTTSIYLCGLDFSGMAAQNREQVFLTYPEIRDRLQPALDVVLARRVVGDSRPVWVLDLPLCVVDSPYYQFFPADGAASGGLAFYDAPDHDVPLFGDKVPVRQTHPSEVCATCLKRDACRGTWSSALKCHASSEYRAVTEVVGHA